VPRRRLTYRTNDFEDAGNDSQAGWGEGNQICQRHGERVRSASQQGDVTSMGHKKPEIDICTLRNCRKLYIFETCVHASRHSGFSTSDSCQSQCLTGTHQISEWEKVANGSQHSNAQRSGEVLRTTEEDEDEEGTGRASDDKPYAGTCLAERSEHQVTTTVERAHRASALACVVVPEFSGRSASSDMFAAGAAAVSPSLGLAWNCHCFATACEKCFGGRF
jgi:hypothetical protein